MQKHFSKLGSVYSILQSKIMWRIAINFVLYHFVPREVVKFTERRIFEPNNYIFITSGHIVLLLQPSRSAGDRLFKREESLLMLMRRTKIHKVQEPHNRSLQQHKKILPTKKSDKACREYSITYRLHIASCPVKTVPV